MALNRNLEFNASCTAVAKKRAANSCSFKTAPCIPGLTRIYLPKNRPVAGSYPILSITHVGKDKYSLVRADAQNRIKIESGCPSQ